MIQISTILDSLRLALAPLRDIALQVIPVEWIGSLPALNLVGFSLLILLVGMKRNPLLLSFIGVITSGVWMLVFDSTLYGSSFGGLFVRNPMSDFFIIMILVVAVFVLMSSTLFGGDKGPYNFLLLMSFAGAIWVVMATDLVALFIAWELMSTPTYILAALGPHRGAVDGATKYFVMGLLSTTFLIFGIAIIIGVTGVTSLSAVGASISTIWLESATSPAAAYTIILALITFIIAFGFKIGVFPGWMWVPDTYSTADGSVTSYLAGATKKAGIAALIQILMVGMFAARIEWMPLLVIVSILTMIIGNLFALAEKNIMRMLAYSSIAMMGYLLIGMAVGTELGTAAALFHAFIHAIMKTGSFILIWSMAVVLGKQITYDHLIGLSKKAPMAAASFSVLILSLAGMPLTAGFWSKLILFQSAVEVGMWWLALIALLNSVFSLGYYLRVLKVMYMDGDHSTKSTDDSANELNLPRIPMIAVIISSIAVLILFIMPGILLDYAVEAATFLLG
ncbi:MAG: Fpo dehydrogenase subunit N [Candidatus Thorarchaeota archaeon]|nr:MAG: Fpo dehydrogenase subunit N [Candidatus Thorarchaeota archaeon]